MSPLYLYNGQLLVKDGILSTSINCCCLGSGCVVCIGSGCCDTGCTEENCCNGQYCATGICCNNECRYQINNIGTCCNDIWYTEEGTCCSGVWHESFGTCCGTGLYVEPGVCCGGEWHTDNGICCGGLWYTGSGNCCGDSISGTWFEPCTGNLTFYQNINGCCGCLDSLNLPECCDGECNALCCEENEFGVPICSEKKINLCTNGTIVQDCEPCTQVGCCITGVYQGIMSAANCLSMNGHIIPINITTCIDTEEETVEDKCYGNNFDENCCIEIKSQSNGLLLSQPFNKRYPPIGNTTIKATIIGTTDSIVSINGKIFGVDTDPIQRCNINYTLYLCTDSLEIEPIPSENNFRCLDIIVCWDKEDSINLSTIFLTPSTCATNNTIILGANSRNCITKLVYN